MADENRAAMDHWVDLWNTGNLEAAAGWIAKDVLFHSQAHLPADIKGHDQLKERVDAFHKAFADIHFAIEDTVATADKIVQRYVLTATHQADFYGIAASGRKITVDGISIHRFANGMVAEHWTVNNWAVLFQ
jgi:steroid delta-isomerase-like uncharacterized protein